jgi:hypothetical protein
MKANAGCLVILFLLHVVFGGIMFQYVLRSFTGKDVPIYVDFVCGLFLAEFLVPATVVTWALSFVISTPFIA